MQHSRDTNTRTGSVGKTSHHSTGHCLTLIRIIIIVLSDFDVLVQPYKQVLEEKIKFSLILTFLIAKFQFFFFFSNCVGMWGGGTQSLDNGTAAWGQTSDAATGWGEPDEPSKGSGWRNPSPNPVKTGENRNTTRNFIQKNPTKTETLDVCYIKT